MYRAHSDISGMFCVSCLVVELSIFRREIISHSKTFKGKKPNERFRVKRLATSGEPSMDMERLLRVTEWNTVVP